LQSQMNEYKNVIANQKADITQKQSNLTTWTFAWCSYYSKQNVSYRLYFKRFPHMFQGLSDQKTSPT
jgi:hypothetical protein